MPYNAGVPQPGASFAPIGQGINQNAAAFQQQQDLEKLRQFYARLGSGQGNLFQGGMDPSFGGRGFDAGGNPLGAESGSQPIAPPAGHQQYVKNAGVNALLNSVIKPDGSGGGGAMSKWAALKSL